MSSVEICHYTVLYRSIYSLWRSTTLQNCTEVMWTVEIRHSTALKKVFIEFEDPPLYSIIHRSSALWRSATRQYCTKVKCPEDPPLHSTVKK
jgi:hypothetical protein